MGILTLVELERVSLDLLEVEVSGQVQVEGLPLGFSILELALVPIIRVMVMELLLLPQHRFL